MENLSRVRAIIEHIKKKGQNVVEKMLFVQDVEQNALGKWVWTKIFGPEKSFWPRALWMHSDHLLMSFGFGRHIMKRYCRTVIKLPLYDNLQAGRIGISKCIITVCSGAAFYSAPLIIKTILQFLRGVKACASHFHTSRRSSFRVKWKNSKKPLANH